MKDLSILKVRDPSDSGHLKIPVLADLPFKMCIVGRSQVSLGKSTIITNLLLRPQYGYRDIYKGHNIFIISNNSLDKKIDMMMEELDIPLSNYMSFNESKLEALYELLEEQHHEDDIKEHKLIVFDDCAFAGDLKSSQHGTISRIVCNGRHMLLSSIFTSQKFTLLSTTIRSQCTALFIGNMSNKEIDCIEGEFNVLENKRQFYNMVRANTTERNFVMVNLSNSPDEGIYLDSKFNKIDVSKYK